MSLSSKHPEKERQVERLVFSFSMKFAPCGTSEILLRNMKYADAYEIFALQMLKGEFYFTFCVSKIFHNPQGLFHIA